MKANVPPEDEIYVAPLGYLSSLQRKFVASDKYFGEQFFVWVEEGIANQQLSGLGVDWLLIDSLHIDLKAKPRLEDYLSKNWVPAMKIGTQTLYRKR